MKLGIVLEGGASRALFSSGVMDFFLDKNIKADYVIGVSAGISNGMSYVSGQKGRPLEISKYFSDPRYMGIRHLLNPKIKSFYNLAFAFGTVPNEYIPFDHDSYMASGCETLAGVTNIETGEIEFLHVPAHDNSWTTLIASCALPILFRPVEINGKKYLDGGIADAVPVDKAIEDGCDKIIVITTREKSYLKSKDKGATLSAMVYRKHKNLASLLKNRAELYNNSREKLKELEQAGKIFCIAPDDTSGWGRTDSDFDKLKAIYIEGYKTAERLYPRLIEYLK